MAGAFAAAKSPLNRAMTENLALAFGLKFEDLYCRAGLVRLDGCFVDFLKESSPELHNRLMVARAAPEQLSDKTRSDLLSELAPQLEAFVANLFGIENDVRSLQSRHQALAPLYAVKRLFVQRRTAKKFSAEQAASFDGAALRRELELHLGGSFNELRFAQQVDAWMKAEAANGAALELAARYAAWA